MTTFYLSQTATSWHLPTFTAVIKWHSKTLPQHKCHKIITHQVTVSVCTITTALNFFLTILQVTVFGSDSGATSLLALLSTKDTAGLFHRAWLMSPSPRFEAMREDVEKANNYSFIK